MNKRGKEHPDTSVKTPTKRIGRPETGIVVRTEASKCGLPLAAGFGISG